MAAADNDKLVVQRAIAKTRRHALGQVASGAFGAAMIIVFMRSPTFRILFVALNTLIVYFLGRRWLRLRPGGPVVHALLEAPSAVTSIHQWPPKLPPNSKAKPAGIDIVTKDGAKAMLMLDPKDSVGATQLFEALKTRSPDANTIWTAADAKLIPPGQ